MTYCSPTLRGRYVNPTAPYSLTTTNMKARKIFISGCDHKPAFDRPDLFQLGGTNNNVTVWVQGDEETIMLDNVRFVSIASKANIMRNGEMTSYEIHKDWTVSMVPEGTLLVDKGEPA